MDSLHKLYAMSDDGVAGLPEAKMTFAGVGYDAVPCSLVE